MARLVLILIPLNDPTVEGQTTFVEELMDIAGYNPEKIEIYQTLPNKAKVFRVKLDSVNGGFVFIRWDSKKKENYVANKMIDPGVYFNLKAAKEIMRKQTDKANFTVEMIHYLRLLIKSRLISVNLMNLGRSLN